MLFIYEFQTQSKGCGLCSLIRTCWSKIGVWGVCGTPITLQATFTIWVRCFFVPDVQVPIQSNYRSKNRFNKLLIKQRHDFLIYINI